MFVHDGHCALGLVSPSTLQPTITDCMNDCIGRGDNIGYFAYKTVRDNSQCACYESKFGCPDDDDFPDHNSYLIVRGGELLFCILIFN